MKIVKKVKRGGEKTNEFELQPKEWLLIAVLVVAIALVLNGDAASAAKFLTEIITSAAKTLK